ncbi:hypothetical protein KQI82_03555 [Oscillibacter sp. MSJ-2]|uniref:Uncharacterized protein n=1 Tax=Dysosmobacter acutus TaxID=2841504 RepID=A0ABS6F6W7_9FIRM|nr:hypothetical protein [Dysosmobacter acutus]MBU5626016.1 hypothetical protein [Dysosmobacter acutus]
MGMNLWQDGIVAMLAAVGLTSLVWIVVGAFLRMSRSPVMKPVMVLPASGAAPALQQSVHELEQLRGELRAYTTIVILDCGLTDEARKIGELLCAEDRAVVLCTAEEFAQELMERGRSDGGIQHAGGDGT